MSCSEAWSQFPGIIVFSWLLFFFWIMWWGGESFFRARFKEPERVARATVMLVSLLHVAALVVWLLT